MEIAKLIVVFFIIILVMWLKKPLVAAIFSAIVGTVLLYGLSLEQVCSSFWKGGTSWSTIEVLLVFYSITYLQRMLEKRKNLYGCQIALNGLFNNRRVNAAAAPLLLGCLPAASTILICGPIVRDSVGEHLEPPEQAAVTTYFRHITESFLPTYTTIFMAIGFTNGAVTVSGFVLAMFPMVVTLFCVGYLIYLRRVPKDTGMAQDHPKSYYAKLLFKSVWSIVLAIAIILIFKLPVELAVLICIVINLFVNRFSPSEALSFFRTAFEPRLLLSTWLIMIFKEVLAATGVISKLPAFFSVLPLPTFLIFALIFFFGSVIAGAQAIIVLCMPMAMEAIAGGPVLPLFILLMCMNYIAMQISPVHVCLPICAEDFKVSLSTLIAKTMPMVICFSAVSFLYYGLLQLLMS